ncbi:acyl-CoA dehydrogenase [Constrictibacter sp. MBR-5]|jgi:alkylation response protein AidB-like acyl-CoA dehydrogenase|uniref:acyl-CoA dehydrogenase family protein n=1 Tax=Constrictibacter sp. MBR-5 TaxID=3156467 RepID=UPI00339363D2
MSAARPTAAMAQQSGPGAAPDADAAERVPHVQKAGEVAAASLVASNLVAPDCRGQNFYRVDHGLRTLLPLYLDAAPLAHFAPHFDRMGELAGGRLDELADAADKHPPVLHPRDRFGRDEDRIEYHPAYREMERIAFGDFGLHAMSHRPGILGWPETAPPAVKYTLQYLFVQAEFGLMCPISVTDTSAYLLGRYGDAALRRRFFEPMTDPDTDRMLTGTQFMTEKTGGSDVGNIELTARPDGDRWRLWGEKWFCSHADADVALLLARPEGAPGGTRGLALFAMPRTLDDGRRNAYRIVRLKDKLGTRSMASGEIVFDGAEAFLVGEAGNGLKQMLDQVNLSRLSHGVRAAAMMRRCLNEALAVARNRTAFGRRLIDMPMVRRQLAKLMTPTEQALSMYLFTAATMDAAQTGDPGAAKLLRILTPLLKFRTARDNILVATGAMEMRGGTGYIEEWVNPRLVRDAHIGVLWEGTSNINALDVIGRAVAKDHADLNLQTALHRKLDEADGVPGEFRARIAGFVDRAVDYAEEVAARPRHEKLARLAATALYNATTAALLTWEGARSAAAGGDARRLILAKMVAEHRLVARDPMTIRDDSWQETAKDLLLSDESVPLMAAVQVL